MRAVQVDDDFHRFVYFALNMSNFTYCVSINHRNIKVAVEHMGKETIDAAIVRCLGDEQLAQCLAYVFRMYDFREWSNR